MAGLFGQARADDIYSCVDAHGRHLTADRPIAECIDREQKQLNPSGTVKRKIGPSLTAEERAAEEEKVRQAIEERNRLAEEKKRERALLVRYPDRGAHDKERTAAILLIDEAIVAASKSIDELLAARKRLDTELEFYGKDASKVPAKLKRQIEENEQHIAAQRRFIANQDNEKKRINTQFDEELVKLKQLWARRAAPVTPTAATPASAVRPATAKK
ncbi:MAG TPA: DUF4124 domain-containing protein [Ramlibacter sp.]|nr:DUF4124 domain-containing protein [Ramlibacter sp.]